MSQVQAEVTAFAEYPKIDTLFDRDERFVVDPAKLRKPLLAFISAWDVTEKIDGTNVRVILDETGEVHFGGRTQTAQLPADLIAVLVKMFPAERLKATFWGDSSPKQVVLFGEGYGSGIQKGRIYRADKSFILFDVLVDGKWWLDREAIGDVAAKLCIETVPYLGRMTLEEIVELVRTPFLSKIGAGMAEGVVARPPETLFDKRMERIIIKLKTRDFTAGRR
jgi:ATP-dependent RNA circularization protein (DNA/RNA ligase family)